LDTIEGEKDGFTNLIIASDKSRSNAVLDLSSKFSLILFSTSEVKSSTDFKSGLILFINFTIGVELISLFVDFLKF